jgi:hypothetical protein
MANTSLCEATRFDRFRQRHRPSRWNPILVVDPQPNSSKCAWSGRSNWAVIQRCQPYGFVLKRLCRLMRTSKFQGVPYCSATLCGGVMTGCLPMALFLWKRQTAIIGSKVRFVNAPRASGETCGLEPKRAPYAGARLCRKRRPAETTLDRSSQLSLVQIQAYPSLDLTRHRPAGPLPAATACHG